MAFGFLAIFTVLLVAFQIGVLPLLAGVIAVTRNKPRVVWLPRLALWFTLVYPIAMTLWTFLMSALILFMSTAQPTGLDPLQFAIVLSAPSALAGIIYGLSFRSWVIAAAPQLASFAVLASATALANGGQISILHAVLLAFPWSVVVVVIGFLVLRRRPMWRYKPGRCGQCGYDLSGLAFGSACPECAALPVADKPGSSRHAVAPPEIKTAFCGKCWYDRSGLRPGVKCPNCGAWPE